MRAWSKRVTSGLLILVILVLLGIMIGTRLSYGTLAVVLSASMEPALPQGALAVTVKVDADKIKVGDIIAFRSEENPDITTSHRVVEILTDDGELLFRTKGDANEEADAISVAASNVVGKVCFDIPCVGYVTWFVKSPPGLLISLCLPGLIIIITEVRNIRRVLTNREMV